MKQQIIELIETTVERLYSVQPEVELSRPDEQFGDFSTNVALKLAKQLGSNPREVAAAIAAELSSGLITKVEVAGPGFINLTVTDKVLQELSRDDIAMIRSGTRVVIETNNPNPFKSMHIGHAFNSILADTIANLIESTGAETHRVSYHGDVGLHIGKSMYSLLKFIDGNPDKLNEIEPNERNKFMTKMYAEGSKVYSEDEQAKHDIDQLAQQSFTREDPVYAKVYDVCLDWSFNGLDVMLAHLGNKPIERRYLESQADAIGVETVKAHVPDVFIESEGAYIFPGEKYGIFDNVFVSSKGRGLYGARDLGLMQLKNNDYHPDKSYIVTAVEQKDYFRGVIKAAELCLPELREQTVNIAHGTAKLTTGKMSSRDGDVLEIGWLFEQIGRAIIDRGGEVSDDVLAGALRYQFLRVRIGGDVIFDIDEAVSLQGNSGPYLQYAHARACGILAKGSLIDDQSLGNLEPGERSLLRKISEFTDVVDNAASELAPHNICAYLYELAQSFNRFYENNRVIDDPRQDLRLQLVGLYADKLKAGLSYLGIAAPDKM